MRQNTYKEYKPNAEAAEVRTERGYEKQILWLKNITASCEVKAEIWFFIAHISSSCRTPLLDE